MICLTSALLLGIWQPLASLGLQASHNGLCLCLVGLPLHAFMFPLLTKGTSCIGLKRSHQPSPLPGFACIADSFSPVADSCVAVKI